MINHAVCRRQGEEVRTHAVTSQAVDVALPGSQSNGRVEIRHTVSCDGDVQTCNGVVGSDGQIASTLIQIQIENNLFWVSDWRSLVRQPQQIAHGPRGQEYPQ